MASNNIIDNRLNGFNTHSFYEEYEIVFDMILGRGANGSVYLIKDKVSNRTYALKQLNYSEKGCREFRIHYFLSVSKYIVEIVDVFTIGSKINVVMEYMKGGTLDAHIRNKNLSERTCANMAYQLCKAVQYIHKQNIVHRDLKPENILLVEHSSEEPELKLTDFGISQWCPSGEKINTSVRYTRDFAAPEVLQNEEYDFSCDIWSLGVIFYMLLSDGEKPFPREDGCLNRHVTPKQASRITQGRLDLQGGKWQCVSKDAKDLLYKMLVPKPNLRATLDQVLKHNWFKNREKLSEV